ncbi:MAG: putative protein YqeN [Phycisphaerae bacterium]|nr:putative protein YqeN [Phycisphaerae bacterium]
MTTHKAGQPPIVVIFGDERFQKADALRRVLERLLPPDVDRTMALCEFDAGRGGEAAAVDFATVADELRTLPFLTDRRVVVIRDADPFVQAHREALERYVQNPAATGTLILECKTFPKTTRLHKAAASAGGELIECRKLNASGAVDFVLGRVRAGGKRVAAGAASRLIDLVGVEQGILAGEVDKLCLYVGNRPEISDEDVTAIVGSSREEKVFAVMDAALAGRAGDALRLWDQVTSTDPAGIFKALGGVAYVVRRLLTAHQMAAEGASISAIAPKVMMFRREAELKEQMRRFPPARLTRALAALAELDMRTKLGLRSMETSIERFVVETAG